MGDLLRGIVKGLSDFIPQDIPDVKIFNAETKIKEEAEKEEQIYARLGRQVYESGGSDAYPDIKAELDLLVAKRLEAEHQLEEARNEKIARERAEAESAANDCPGCGAHNPEGTNFCQECGTKITAAPKRFCPTCGGEIPEGGNFCGSCGSKIA